MTDTTVLFTDLDGSLLDHDTYLPGPAEEALHDVVNSGTWVFFCSAKTHAEQADLAKRLDVEVGFITENGALAILPGNAGRQRFGVSYEEIRRGLVFATKKTGIEVSGYGDLDVGRVSSVTGLSPDQAELARRRCCTETIIDLADSDAGPLGRALTHEGLRLQRGARFWSVQGEHDKGTAIAWVMSQFSDDTVSCGIGDGPNDEAMLRQVEMPFLVKAHDGRWATIRVEGLSRVEGVGPIGWVEAAKTILST